MLIVIRAAVSMQRIAVLGRFAIFSGAVGEQISLGLCFPELFPGVDCCICVRVSCTPASAAGCGSGGESQAGDNAGAERYHWGNSAAYITN